MHCMAPPVHVSCKSTVRIPCIDSGAGVVRSDYARPVTEACISVSALGRCSAVCACIFIIVARSPVFFLEPSHYMNCTGYQRYPEEGCKWYCWSVTLGQRTITVTLCTRLPVGLPDAVLVSGIRKPIQYVSSRAPCLIFWNRGHTNQAQTAMAQ